MSEVQSDVHLQNAARTLGRILNARDSEHVYTVDVRPLDGDDASSLSSSARGKPHIGAVAKDSNTVGNRHAGAAAHRTHGDRSKKAA